VLLDFHELLRKQAVRRSDVVSRFVRRSSEENKMNRLVGVLAPAAAALLFVACGAGSEGDNGGSAASPKPRSESPEQPIAVEAVEISEGYLTTEISTSGVVSAAREARVVSQTQGVIERVSFELGNRVEAGEPLVAFDDAVERSNVEQARAQYESAQLELRTTEQLRESGDASEAQLAQARAQAAGARAALAQARERLENRTVTAPISGLVALRGDGVKPGNYLTAGRTVAEIVDLSTLEIELSLGEREVQLVREGLPATVAVDACESLQQAEVAAVAAGSDERTGSYTALVRWDNQCGEAIKAGMNATVTVRTARQGEEVLIAPTTSIQSGEESQFVWVAREGAVTRREVTVGAQLGARTEITGGLEIGDVVIISALGEMGEGQAVEVSVIGTSRDIL
jgi:RND family efflux transporter MFP subunit